MIAQTNKLKNLNLTFSINFLHWKSPKFSLNLNFCHLRHREEHLIIYCFLFISNFCMGDTISPLLDFILQVLQPYVIYPFV